MENKIELYELVFLKDSHGWKRTSFVDDPAIFEKQLYFRNEEDSKFHFVSEERGIVMSPLFIPDLIIKRKDPETGEMFAVKASKETIELMLIKWMSEGRQNMADQMHDQEDVNGVTWYQAFISDEQMGIHAPDKWKHLPYGTLFGCAKVTNPEIKQKIKDGTYQGISIEAMFGLKPVQLTTEEQIDAITDDILNEL